MVFYIDKSQTLECTLNVSGGSNIKNTNLRLNIISEYGNFYYLAENKEGSNVDWVFKIPALSKMEICEATITVECMLDSYYFLVHEGKVEVKRVKPLVNFNINSTNTPTEEKIKEEIQQEQPKIKFSIKYEDDPIEDIVDNIKEESNQVLEETEVLNESKKNEIEYDVKDKSFLNLLRINGVDLELD